MKADKPVTKKKKEYSGRLVHILREATKLKTDQELPVLCDSFQELRSSQATACAHGFSTRTDNLNLYISKRS